MPRIAVIDDDIYIGDLLEEVLTRQGYDVLRAYSGTEALYLLRQQRPDLVLLDLMLPGLSGEEVLPKLAGIPVIVLSAKVDIQGKIDLLLGGAADYVTKPFDTGELLARIAVQLRKGLLQNEIQIAICTNSRPKTTQIPPSETTKRPRERYSFMHFFRRDPFCNRPF